MLAPIPSGSPYCCGAHPWVLTLIPVVSARLYAAAAAAGNFILRIE